MQQLHLVGLTTELDSLIFSTRKGTKSGGFTVRLDDRFVEIIAEAVRRREEEAATAGLNASRNRPASSLSPREIQARLRSGQPRDEIAAEAGVDEDWVARFEAPVLAERAQVVARTHQLVYAKPRLGESAQPLGVSVRWNLADKGVRMPTDQFDRHWSAYQLPDGRWVVAFEFVSRKKAQSAVWEVDLREGSVLARNRVASELAYVEPGRRRRTYVEPDSLSASPQPKPTRGSEPAEVELPLVDVAARPSRSNGGASKPAPRTTTAAGKAAKSSKSSKSAAASKAASKSAKGAAGRSAKKAAPRARAARTAGGRGAAASGAAAGGRARAPARVETEDVVERPPLIAARRAPAPPPPDPNMDELTRRRLEMARARPGPLPGSGPRRAAELRRFVVPPPEVVPPMRTEVEEPPAPMDGLDVPMEDRVAQRRAERAAERRARAAAARAGGDAGVAEPEEDEQVEQDLLDREPTPVPELPPAPPRSGETRVVRIRADRADGTSAGGDGFDMGQGGGAGSRSWDDVRPARRGPLRPAMPAAQPRKRRFGRAR